MDSHIKKVYVPMTETGFYILLCLRTEAHGYSIVQKVDAMTGGEIKISPGTMYGSLSKMEKDKLIGFVREEDKRRIYRITDLGAEVLEVKILLTVCERNLFYIVFNQVAHFNVWVCIRCNHFWRKPQIFYFRIRKQNFFFCINPALYNDEL